MDRYFVLRSTLIRQRVGGGEPVRRRPSPSFTAAQSRPARPQGALPPRWRRAPAPLDPAQAEDRQREIQELRGLLHGVVRLLIERRVIGGRS